MKHDLWWHAPIKHGPVHVFQLLLGAVLMLLILPFAIVAEWARRK